MVDTQARCQSCGMPISKGFFGTNVDNTPNQEYCKFCFKKGSFTEPDITMPRMIESSAEFMATHLLLPPMKAKDMAKKTIPTLKRWKYSALDQVRQEAKQSTQQNQNPIKR